VAVESRIEPGFAAAAPGSGRAAAVHAAAHGGPRFFRSAVSWPAILAGAFVAISSSLILIVLGSGIGFAAVSPWPGHGVSHTGLTVTAAIWLIVTQWISSALGGYIAGRLRTKWSGTHTHEVFFRDTAHGLITWSVSMVFVAWVVAASASSAVENGLHTAASSMGSVGSADSAASHIGSLPGPPSAAMTYEIDRLFRPGASSNANPAGTPGESSSDARVETVYIAYHAITANGASDADRSYLAELVEAQAGISSAEARSRVDDFFSSLMSAAEQARLDADKARKAAAEASIYTALSLLIGAFIASVTAAIGGRLRDSQEH
jgi:hypothetical protein